ncbi:uncharacterized protein LOC116347228 isoform X2 [Contarinia nasturtii]|uniref:uncharacterized protein LOC116347228 isoform X2 n=1 Tax=Contarinia nasturtii TaxID=265458 RepID=UPI0012D3B0A7|nr:uncharacterized protein LOC116347228 isoform X2 [Contarinia nasturtii]
MPEFVDKKILGQLTTIQANSSRMVTACRFAVETRNGHMKTIWQLFDRTWITYDLPHAMTDYRIGASLINKFRLTFESNKNDAETIAQSMIEKVAKNEFRLISMGNYQPHLALSYIHEQIELDGLKIFVYPVNLVKTVFKNLIKKYEIKSPIVVLTFFKSRFRNNVKHYVYILADQAIKDRKDSIWTKLKGNHNLLITFFSKFNHHHHHLK